MSLTASERKIRGAIASHESWARTPDRTARTAPGRAALMKKFETQVDPDGVMTPEARRKAAESARKAYFQRLALASSKARRARKAGE